MLSYLPTTIAESVAMIGRGAQAGLGMMPGLEGPGFVFFTALLAAYCYRNRRLPEPASFMGRIIIKLPGFTDLANSVLSKLSLLAPPGISLRNMWLGGANSTESSTDESVEPSSATQSTTEPLPTSNATITLAIEEITRDEHRNILLEASDGVTHKQIANVNRTDKSVMTHEEKWNEPNDIAQKRLNFFYHNKQSANKNPLLDNPLSSGNRKNSLVGSGVNNLFTNRMKKEKRYYGLYIELIEDALLDKKNSHIADESNSEGVEGKYYARYTTFTSDSEGKYLQGVQRFEEEINKEQYGDHHAVLSSNLNEEEKIAYFNNRPVEDKRLKAALSTILKNADRHEISSMELSSPQRSGSESRIPDSVEKEKPSAGIVNTILTSLLAIKFSSSESVMGKIIAPFILIAGNVNNKIEGRPIEPERLSLLKENSLSESINLPQKEQVSNGDILIINKKVSRKEAIDNAFEYEKYTKVIFTDLRKIAHSASYAASIDNNVETFLFLDILHESLSLKLKNYKIDPDKKIHVPAIEKIIEQLRARINNHSYKAESYNTNPFKPLKYTMQQRAILDVAIAYATSEIKKSADQSYNNMFGRELMSASVESSEEESDKSNRDNIIEKISEIHDEIDNILFEQDRDNEGKAVSISSLLTQEIPLQSLLKEVSSKNEEITPQLLRRDWDVHTFPDEIIDIENLITAIEKWQSSFLENRNSILDNNVYEETISIISKEILDIVSNDKIEKTKSLNAIKSRNRKKIRDHQKELLVAWFHDDKYETSDIEEKIRKIQIENLFVSFVENKNKDYKKLITKINLKMLTPDTGESELWSIQQAKYFALKFERKNTPFTLSHDDAVKKFNEITNKPSNRGQELMQTSAIVWYLRRHSEKLKHSKKSLKRGFIALSAEKEFYSALKKISNEREEKSEYSSISNIANSNVFLEQDPNENSSPINKMFVQILDAITGKTTRTYNVKKGDETITYEAKDGKTAFYDQFIRYKKESLGKEKEALSEHAFHRSSVTLLENNSPVTESYSYKIQIHNHRNKVFKSIYDKPDGYISFAKIESGKWFVISTVGMNILIKPLPGPPPIKGDQDFNMHKNSISAFIDELWDDKPIHSPQAGDNFESAQGMTYHYEYKFKYDTKKRDHSTLSSFTQREVEKLLLDMVEVYKNTLRDTEWWEYMSAMLPGFELLQRLSHDADYSPKLSEYAFEVLELAFMLASLGISVSSLSKKAVIAISSAFMKAKAKGIAGKALIKIVLTEAAAQIRKFDLSLAKLMARISLYYISPLPFLDDAAIFGVRKIMKSPNKMLLGKAINPASFRTTGKKMLRVENATPNNQPAKVFDPKNYQGVDFTNLPPAERKARLLEAYDPSRSQWDGGRNIDRALPEAKKFDLMEAESELLDTTRIFDANGDDTLKGGIVALGKKHALHLNDNDLIDAYKVLTDNNDDTLDLLKNLRTKYENSPDEVKKFFMDEFRLNDEDATLCADNFFNAMDKTQDVVEYTKAVNLENVWLSNTDNYQGFTVGGDPMKRIMINYKSLNDGKMKRTMLHESSHHGARTGDYFYHADVTPGTGYSDIPGSIRKSLHKGLAGDDIGVALFKRTEDPSQAKYLNSIENELGPDVITRNGETVILNTEAFDAEMAKQLGIKNNKQLPFDERMAAENRLRAVRDTMADVLTDGEQSVSFILKSNADTLAFTVQAMAQRFFPSHNIIKRSIGVPQDQNSDKSMMHLWIYLSARLAKKQ